MRSARPEELGSKCWARRFGVGTKYTEFSYLNRIAMHPDLTEDLLIS
ncbi:MAG: hypothetical protein ACE5GD_04635 [Candidatus Geothermarchaeales archaeon]